MTAEDDPVFAKVDQIAHLPPVEELPPPESDLWAPSDPAGKWAWEEAFKADFWAGGWGHTPQTIALLLATYADGKTGGGARPSVATLVRVSGWARSTVLEALKQLRLSGWVQQVSQGSSATRRASEYQLSIPRVRGAGR